ncbi:rho family-interacting cell polarization regulator 2 isoform X2 [Electrophorus electricus]|uniref:Rho family-interacting cell polarization regulator 2 n=2 Tax=Electrophorus electricus TaxID=8005 RepID=A0A4W4G6A7_ELEEL|nr:rho family-interacting cell polarization regulator 2 isoform X2 [Electrophorus electricus]XP_026862181.2 rho family-interacting cell polarization regulator 2 isoform X2 [Electrophorus electricus]XP_026862182.2 rho family-interacting cell polarization regulator 2 isoform X2 [Electrophorus electricus]
MAAGTHSPGGPNGIIRSQSFAGFSTLQEKRSRCNSFMGNTVVQKKLTSKPKKAHLSGHKASSSSSCHEPQPRRVEEVYRALKQGLDEYLEVHQLELDKLTSLMKDMKRNSRLGVLYDLDKQIKAIERYMRRLEFHISKVDELYEGFCIQRRLREGASKMKQAFTASPSTKGTRESLAEVNRRYKEYTENMSTFEGEVENLLGEFHIKMKGLAGFARLCPGDQYEIFMRYGRQRWKLKGRIEANSRQSWDGEEMIFMPLITDLISIKVTELKGLATHVLVGSVICETKDLFTAMPQVVAVDVNDLGTIKLNLEVTWFPFDVEDLTLSSGNVSKATALQRRVSIYSQGTPETPTFQDTAFFAWQPLGQQGHLSFLHTLRDTLLEKLRRSHSFGDLAALRPRPRSSLEFYSTLPDDVFDIGGCGMAECKRLSFTFSDTPASSPGQAQSNPEITVTPPELDPPLQFCPSDDQPIGEEEGEEAVENGSVSASLASASEADSKWDRTEDHVPGYGSAAPLQSSEGQLSAMGPVDVVFLEPRGPDETSELKPVELDGEEGSVTRQLVRRLTSSEIVSEAGPQSWAGEGSGAFLENSLEEAIQSLLLRLESLGQRCRELQDLEQEVMKLEDLLKCRGPAPRSRSSSLSLTVESALESFDFLNTSDFDDDDTGDDTTAVFFDMETERIGPGEPPEARGHLSEALTEDTGVGNSVAGSPMPLTTGNENLDVAIVIHLQYCNHLIQLLMTGGSSWQHKACLHKLSTQTLLLEELTEKSINRLGSITSAADVLPGLTERPALLALWSECSGSGGLFHTTLDRVFKQMHNSFTPLQDTHPHHADSVIRLVVSEMVDRSELASSPCPSPSSFAQDVLTVFQFHSYATAHNVTNMEQHLLEVTREAVFADQLCSGEADRSLQELKEMSVTCLQPRPHTLHALATLLISSDPDLRKATTAFLSSAASYPPFRSKALDCYTQALSEAGVHTQKAACAALSCLQAVESISAVVSLCDSADEELQHVAIETLFTFGEEGRLAYEQLDTVPKEMVRLGTRRGNAVTTAF